MEVERTWRISCVLMMTHVDVAVPHDACDPGSRIDFIMKRDARLRAMHQTARSRARLMWRRSRGQLVPMIHIAIADHIIRISRFVGAHCGSRVLTRELKIG
jgi:hypothetical protein